jgi:hypothetical protein
VSKMDSPVDLEKGQNVSASRSRSSSWTLARFSTSISAKNPQSKSSIGISDPVLSFGCEIYSAQIKTMENTRGGRVYCHSSGVRNFLQ